MLEKGIRGGIFNAIYWYTKANNIDMNGYDENKESSYLNYWDVNNLRGWQRHKSFQHLIFNGLKIFCNLLKIL